MLKNPGWEMLIVCYFFFGGIAGGAFFAAAIADNFGSARDGKVARVGYLLSLPLVALCGVLLIADLGVPLRFLNMMRTFKFSDPMSIGAWMLGVFGAFSFACSALSFTASESMIALRRKLGFVGMFFGFFLASYTGVLLSATALPLWSDARLMGALFLASGASTGIAAISLILFLIGASTGESWRKVTRADRFSIIFELVVLAALVVLLGSAARPLTMGHYAPLFWGGLVVAGLLVPLVIDFAGHRMRALTAVASVLVLAGGFILRYVMLMSAHS
jgi:formate-dependent nitrite reductase membrane component NrfD